MAQWKYRPDTTPPAPLILKREQYLLFALAIKELQSYYDDEYEREQWEYRPDTTPTSPMRLRAEQYRTFAQAVEELQNIVGGWSVWKWRPTTKFSAGRFLKRDQYIVLARAIQELQNALFIKEGLLVVERCPRAGSASQFTRMYEKLASDIRTRGGEPKALYCYVDNSGSMATDTIQPAYNSFLSGVSGVSVYRREWKDERWVPKLTEHVRKSEPPDDFVSMAWIDEASPYVGDYENWNPVRTWDSDVLEWKQSLIWLKSNNIISRFGCFNVQAEGLVDEIKPVQRQYP